MINIDDRSYWIETMLSIAGPVLEAAAQRKLRVTMPVEGKTGDREQYTHLEAIGRTLAGLAPWLESGPRHGD